MQLSAYTDYAFRLLVRLGVTPDELVTIQQIADEYHISKNHLTKIAHQLGKAGLIQTVRGRNGGLRLVKDPAEINLGTVVRLTEESLNLVECFDGERNRCAITGVCALQGILTDALNAFLAVLDQYTLDDLTRRPREISAALKRMAA